MWKSRADVWHWCKRELLTGIIWGGVWSDTDSLEFVVWMAERSETKRPCTWQGLHWSFIIMYYVHPSVSVSSLCKGEPCKDKVHLWTCSPVAQLCREREVTCVGCAVPCVAEWVHWKGKDCDATITPVEFVPLHHACISPLLCMHSAQHWGKKFSLKKSNGLQIFLQLSLT